MNTFDLTDTKGSQPETADLKAKDSLQDYFARFRKHIIGIDHSIRTPNHDAVPIHYFDWTASGRNYLPIEKGIAEDLMPLVANTHTETSQTGMAMTYAYHKAHQMIKRHVNAGSDDILISCDSGMTGVVNKFQRILGLRLHESFMEKLELKEEERPVVFITHMEHHSNQTSWLETIADVEIIPPGEDGLVSLQNFRELVAKYRSRKMKIASVTSCSNVTGLMTPYMELAKIIHAEGGYCFADFACSAPYVEIDMHPNDAEGAYLDAIFFSPHKFLGGPGSTGILVFNKKLYANSIPDDPGGGTVSWTDPWGKHKYVSDIEGREDGGTPAFLQTIKAARCMKLKEEMGVDNMLRREEEILEMIWPELESIPNLHLLAEQHKDRLGVISFYIDGLNYNVGVKLLNDRYGIQTRGGCSCAGTYGHFLLNLDQELSTSIASLVIGGDCSSKPGWIRMSIHPTHTDEEVKYVLKAIREVAENFREWVKDYDIDLVHGLIKAKDTAAEEQMKNFIDEKLESGLV